MPQDQESTHQRSGVDESLASAAEFTAAFAEHYGACLRIARRLVRDEGLAHDVVQDVFLACWRSGGGGYRPDRGELAPWLSTITHHKAVDALRTAARQRRTVAAARSTLTTRPDPPLVEEVVWWELGKQSLMAALATLPAKQQEVLALAYLAGLSQAEVADRLGIPIGTVKSRTHAGMLRLRAALSTSWTPTGPMTDSPPDALAAAVPGDPRSIRVEGTGPAPRRDPRSQQDVDVCAAALLRIAAEEGDGGAGAESMVERAAALVERHGQAAAYDLIVTLARAATEASTARRSAHG